MCAAGRKRSRTYHKAPSRARTIEGNTSKSFYGTRRGRLSRAEFLGIAMGTKVIDNETIFIISGILGIWTWRFKAFVIESMQKSIDNLADTIADTTDKDHYLDTAVQKHGVVIEDINHRVEKLEHERYN